MEDQLKWAKKPGRGVASPGMGHEGKKNTDFLCSLFFVTVPFIISRNMMYIKLEFQKKEQNAFYGRNDAQRNPNAISEPKMKEKDQQILRNKRNEIRYVETMK